MYEFSLFYWRSCREYTLRSLKCCLNLSHKPTSLPPIYGNYRCPYKYVFLQSKAGLISFMALDDSPLMTSHRWSQRSGLRFVIFSLYWKGRELIELPTPGVPWYRCWGVPYILWWLWRACQRGSHCWRPKSTVRVGFESSLRIYFLRARHSPWSISYRAPNMKPTGKRTNRW